MANPKLKTSREKAMERAIIAVVARLDAVAERLAENPSLRVSQTGIVETLNRVIIKLSDARESR